MPYIYNGKQLREGRGWADADGIQHPANWASAWTPQEKVYKGLVWVDPEPTFDPRFYWSAGVPKALEDVAEVDELGEPLLDEKGQQVITKGLKSVAIEKVKQQAKGLIDPTEWMFTRETDAGAKVPRQVKAFRQAVRNKSAEMEAAITAATTMDEFIALHESTETVPTPLSDWPSEDDTFDYVPDQVSMRQARLALLSAGLLDQVDGAIADPAARIEWEYAQIVKRDSPLIAGLTGGLGLTEAQVDDLFKAAEAF